MSKPTYPTDIVTDDGWGRIHEGHHLNLADLVADLNSARGIDAQDVKVEEVHLTYQHRVMWCEKYGDPCESNGEWHAHWYPVKPTESPGTQFTLVHPRRAGVR